jgi:putative cardiolipin synthase
MDCSVVMKHARLLCLGLLAAIVAGCASQRFQQAPRPQAEFALPPQPADFLAPTESAIAAQHGSESSGFALLDTNEDGLRWRLALVDSARRSIDIQYYLWYGDAAGLLILEHVLAAADRGVKVRLLVDDINMMLRDAGTVRLRDKGVALLDSHPNIELRVFNPWSRRSLVSRAGEMLTDMRRLNQRMHHKMLVADNRAAIVGGRNIGDEYLGLNEDFNFHDLDVLGIGPIARQASGVFDAFWNSEWVLPASALDIEATPAAAAHARTELQARLRAMKSLQRFPVEPQDWTREFEALGERLKPGTSEILTDVPRAGGIAQDMIAAVRELMASAERELLIINAYIIPYDKGIGILRELADGSARVRILTNSLASHDVPAVNSHYKQRRRAILEAGADHGTALEGNGRRPPALLYRLDELRPPLRGHQHRNGRGHRQPRAGGGTRPAH